MLDSKHILKALEHEYLTFYSRISIPELVFSVLKKAI